MSINAKNGKEAVTHYRVLMRFAAYTYVECQLETGRTHQIRVHMAYIGHPLAGDTLYGGSAEKIGRHALHCAVIRFLHPYTGVTHRIASDLPRDMRALAEQDGLLEGWQSEQL